MVIEILLGFAVLIFAVLAFFIIRTLVTLQGSLRRVDQISLDAEMKLKNLDSLLQTVSNLGDIAEKETGCIKKKYLKHKDESDEPTCCSEDIVNWVLASVKLGSKFLKRR